MDSAIFNTLYNEELYQVKPKVVIVVDQEWNSVTAEEKQLLARILQAVKLTFEGVRVVRQDVLNVTGLGTPPHRVICFGKAAAGLALYEPLEVGGISLVISENLSELVKNDAARKKLWGALKLLFFA